LPTRTVFNTEARAWLAANPAAPGTSVVTSLPDASELPKLSFDAWVDWFTSTAEQILAWLPHDGVAIFFQTDVRHPDGRWIDKGHLVHAAADRRGAHLVWHKIVCRCAPGTITQGRPSFAHMLCFSPVQRAKPERPGPDVLADGGAKPWARAMGSHACRVACRFLADETATRVVVDPFCGHGSVLAAANEAGFDAIGVDLSPRRCRFAQTLDLRHHDLRRRAARTHA
jgi:hypothetical protein